MSDQTNVDNVISQRCSKIVQRYYIASFCYMVWVTISGNTWPGLLWMLFAFIVGRLLLNVFLYLRIGAWVEELVSKPADNRLVEMVEFFRRVEVGEIDKDSQEYEDEMIRLGFGKPFVITELGPILGKQEGKDFHEWVDAKHGKDGEIKRFFFDGIFIASSPFGPEGTELVVGHFLYKLAST